MEPISKIFNIQPEELIKQDGVIVNQNQHGGNGAFVINQLSEKIFEQLKEQYEYRITDKENTILLLKKSNDSLQKVIDKLLHTK